MTSKQFEKLAKEKLCDMIRTELDEEFHPCDINTVWFCHILGHKKGIFIDNGPNSRLYEVTYNIAANELYIDMYSKDRNRKYLLSEERK